MTQLNNKVIWITGASSGIGEALAYALAKQSAKLILSSRRKEELERVKNNCCASVQSQIFILPLDLLKTETLQGLTEIAIQFFGHIDILINNAGLGQRSLALDTSLDVDRKIMEINYFGSIALTKRILPHFISRKQGHFVAVSSLTGKFGTPYRSAYAASKHALHGFYDALRAEHWKDNILVTLICPGFIQTHLRSTALAGAGASREQTPPTYYSRKSAAWCALKIIKAIERNKKEVYLGGKEVLGVYLKRFFPSLFSKIIRKVPVR